MYTLRLGFGSCKSYSFIQEQWDMHVNLCTNALKTEINLAEKLFPYKYGH
jgi:pyruvate formate-lyase activating enzyme-like uncharacterized protein